MEITLKIDMRSKPAKAFLKYIKELPFVEIKEKDYDKPDSKKSPYDPEFVKKIRQAEKEESITVDPKDIWGSLGLK